MAKIAFLGLGKMGAGMAHRLIYAGHETHIYNRDIKKTLQLKSLGAVVHDKPATAASGKLTLFLGGDLNIIKRAQSLLDIISIEQLHFGDIGCGTAYKLIVNLMGSIQIAATAEGLLLAKNCGLDLNLVAKSLANVAVGSPQVARQSGLMVTGNHHQNILFNGKSRLKDTRYGMDLAKKFNIDAQLGKQALMAFNKLVDDGYGNLAESKIIDSMALKK